MRNLYEYAKGKEKPVLEKKQENAPNQILRLIRHLELKNFVTMVKATDKSMKEINTSEIDTSIYRHRT